MKYNKKQKEGLRERLAVLAAFEPCAERFFDFVLAEEPSVVQQRHLYNPHA